MGELLWSIFSHPTIIVKPSDAPFMLIGAMAVVFLTFSFTAMAGKHIARKSLLVAVLFGTAFVPALGIATAYTLLSVAPEGPPPNDGPGMLFVIMFVLSICTIPISFLTSAAYVARRPNRNVR
jgi:hypothetical protein